MTLFHGPLDFCIWPFWIDYLTFSMTLFMNLLTFAYDPFHEPFDFYIGAYDLFWLKFWLLHRSLFNGPFDVCIWPLFMDLLALEHDPFWLTFWLLHHLLDSAKLNTSQSPSDIGDRSALYYPMVVWATLNNFPYLCQFVFYEFSLIILIMRLFSQETSNLKMK